MASYASPIGKKSKQQTIEEFLVKALTPTNCNSPDSSKIRDLSSTNCNSPNSSKTRDLSSTNCNSPNSSKTRDLSSTNCNSPNSSKTTNKFKTQDSGCRTPSTPLCKGISLSTGLPCKRPVVSDNYCFQHKTQINGRSPFGIPTPTRKIQLSDNDAK
ncbi:5109_t:CDS:1, partial [Scutellospora calospora]